MLNNELNSIDQTPLKYYGFKTNLYINENIATFKSSSENKIGLVILRVVVIFFWIMLLYNIFTLNLLIGDEAPLFISIILTLIFYIGGIFLTFFISITKIKINYKEFINNNTGEINLLLPNDEKKYNTSDLIGVQLLNYDELRKITNYKSGTSHNITVTLFQINIITNNKTRIPLIVTKNYNNAILFSHKLSAFLDKPLVKNFNQEDIENEIIVKPQKINKYFAIVTADLKTNITSEINLNLINEVQKEASGLIVSQQKFDNFLNNKKFDIEKKGANNIKVYTEDKTLSFLSLPKKYQTITVSVNLYDSADSITKKVKLKTSFRYDILVNTIMTLLLLTIDNFIKLPKVGLINIIIGVTSCLLIYRILIFRSLEIEFVKKIIEELLLDDIKT